MGGCLFEKRSSSTLGVIFLPSPAKPFVVTLVSLVTFALGAAPAAAATDFDYTFAANAPVAAVSSQTLITEVSGDSLPPISSVLELTEIEGPDHNFDVETTIASALSEVGTSRATGWGQAGECIVSVQRWIRAGGGVWTGGGDPVSNYTGATRLPLTEAAAGDVIQYEFLSSPTSWASGIHTVLITGVNDDGSFSIVESNNPAGSGLVTANENWLPAPPAGFEAVVWRF